MGASLDLGDAPARRPLPAPPEQRLDALVVRLAAAAGKPVLLMLDEIQSLGDVAAGEKIIASLRAVLQQHEMLARALLLMIAQGRPPMGRETLDALAKVQGTRPTVAKVRAAMERLRRSGLLTKSAGAPAMIDDPLLADYLQDKSLDQLR